ncbi:uncharacterized protein AMSG_07072 [Thecamonas trahens ATCC 50062]|uniref:Uncharacterized protein n=1 Tax=Thecamonas trahens ATCC 50062 TaxID=461836 RepID=A0A0L0DIE6_THETB|nr:hypothetical protein AMSG_07072 [Thecamonas trahens ATCC 50062]KNC51083.1 hypothetical protein AMSG_07072 [Thecamonas trahens ATCC 50062]|eukprot:XP_013756539.1 hypothetical protein AMSG_07072 [Thecamonas trahens ATCC 50062]
MIDCYKAMQVNITGNDRDVIGCYEAIGNNRDMIGCYEAVDNKRNIIDCALRGLPLQALIIRSTGRLVSHTALMSHLLKNEDEAAPSGDSFVVYLIDPTFWARPVPRIEETIAPLLSRTEELRTAAETVVLWDDGECDEECDDDRGIALDVLGMHASRMLENLRAALRTSKAALEQADEATQRLDRIRAAVDAHSAYTARRARAMAQALTLLEQSQSAFARLADHVMPLVADGSVPDDSMLAYAHGADAAQTKAWRAELVSSSREIVAQAAMVATEGEQWLARARDVGPAERPAPGHASHTTSLDNMIEVVEGANMVYNDIHALPTTDREAAAAAADKLRILHSASLGLHKEMVAMGLQLSGKAAELSSAMVAACATVAKVAQLMASGRSIADSAGQLCAALDHKTAELSKFAVLWKVPALAYRTISGIAVGSEALLPLVADPLAPGPAAAPSDVTMTLSWLDGQMCASLATSQVTDSIIHCAAAADSLSSTSDGDFADTDVAAPDFGLNSTYAVVESPEHDMAALAAHHNTDLIQLEASFANHVACLQVLVDGDDETATKCVEIASARARSAELRARRAEAAAAAAAEASAKAIAKANKIAKSASRKLSQRQHVSPTSAAELELRAVKAERRAMEVQLAAARSREEQLVQQVAALRNQVMQALMIDSISAPVRPLTATSAALDRHASDARARHAARAGLTPDALALAARTRGNELLSSSLQQTSRRRSCRSPSPLARRAASHRNRDVDAAVNRWRARYPPAPPPAAPALAAARSTALSPSAGWAASSRVWGANRAPRGYAFRYRPPVRHPPPRTAAAARQRSRSLSPIARWGEAFRLAAADFTHLRPHLTNDALREPLHVPPPPDPTGNGYAATSSLLPIASPTPSLTATLGSYDYRYGTHSAFASSLSALAAPVDGSPLPESASVRASDPARVLNHSLECARSPSRSSIYNPYWPQP